jgi:hypothetical protein
MLFVLDAADGAPADLQCLVSYDYLLVHSGDISNELTSLHPAVPFRGSELLVKRDALSAGLNQMFSRELIKKHFDNDGITYRSTELTRAFLTLMRSTYALALRVRALWVIDNFGRLDRKQLSEFMTDHIGRWGAEFDHLTAIDQLEL